MSASALQPIQAAMMSNEFYFCPKCGSKNVSFVNDKKWICGDCNLDLYCNVAAAVGLIICSPDGSVVFEKRAKEPRKGFLALPGGFVSPDERAEDAAIRECFEELGIKVSEIKYMASFPNTYEYKGFVYKTCDIFFKTLISNEEMRELFDRISADEKEVSGVTAEKILSPEDIEKLPLAFNSAKKVLGVWIKNED